MSTYVIDASAVLPALLASNGFRRLSKHTLLAPPILWSEVTSALHEAVWRTELTAERGDVALENLEQAPIAKRSPGDLYREAWSVAERLGWAKTYDAEFVALALMLGCPMLTEDAGLQRGAARLVEVLGPADL